MEYSEIVRKLNTDTKFRKKIAQYVHCRNDDFVIGNVQDEEAIFDNTSNEVTVSFEGGSQSYLVTINLIYSSNDKTDLSGIEPTESEDVAEERIQRDKLNFDIDYWSYNITYDQLSRMFSDNKLRTPAMQRGFVWDYIQASKLIESIFMGLPLPSLFLIKQPNHTYLIVDGLQRITSIYSFRYNKKLPNARPTDSGFSLSGVNDQLNHKTYMDLKEENPDILEKFDMGTINVIEFKQNAPEHEEAMYTLFERLNSGGTNLTSQQIRNSIYYGSFNDSLNQYSEKIYKYFTEKKRNAMVPAELFLRSIAIYDLIQSNDYLTNSSSNPAPKSRVVYKSLLNKTALDYHIRYKKIEISNSQNKEELTNKFKNQINEKFKLLEQSVKKVESIFGDNSFKTYNTDTSKFGKRLLPTLFEALTVCIMLNDNSEITKSREKIIEQYKNIFFEENGNSTFEKYFTQGTGVLSNIIDRVKTMQGVLYNDAFFKQLS